MHLYKVVGYKRDGSEQFLYRGYKKDAQDVCRDWNALDIFMSVEIVQLEAERNAIGLANLMNIELGSD